MKEEKLHLLLQKKRGFFEAILELTHLQHTLSLDEWIALLEQKKTLISCVEAIDEELKVFFGNFSSISQEIIEELDAIRNLTHQIMTIDQDHLEKRKLKLLGSRWN